MVEQKIKLKDIEINYKHFNEKSPLPPLRQAQGRLFEKEGKNIFLILRGWGGSSDSWKKVCNILKNDCEIYALDFPFFGKSNDLKEIWEVDDYVELVEEFIEDVIFSVKKSPFIPLCERGKLTIIAHSFGGRVAIKMAAKNPEWLEKLFLCDSAGIKHLPSIKQRLANKLSRIGKYLFRENIRVINPRDDQREYNLALPLKSAVLKFSYKLIGVSDYYNCKNEVMRETFKNIITEDLTPYLLKIKIPTVIIWGEKDKYTPLADGILMNKEIQNSKLYIIKGVGHGVHLFAPEKICEIIKKTLL